VVFQRELTGSVPLTVRYNVKPQKEKATFEAGPLCPWRVLPPDG
jgi:hypothetical protein